MEKRIIVEVAGTYESQINEWDLKGLKKAISHYRNKPNSIRYPDLTRFGFSKPMRTKSGTIVYFEPSSQQYYDYDNDEMLPNLDTLGGLDESLDSDLGAFEADYKKASAEDIYEKLSEVLEHHQMELVDKIITDEFKAYKYIHYHNAPINEQQVLTIYNAIKSVYGNTELVNSQEIVNPAFDLEFYSEDGHATLTIHANNIEENAPETNSVDIGKVQRMLAAVGLEKQGSKQIGKVSVTNYTTQVPFDLDLTTVYDDLVGALPNLNYDVHDDGSVYRIVGDGFVIKHPGNDRTSINLIYDTNLAQECMENAVVIEGRPTNMMELLAQLKHLPSVEDIVKLHGTADGFVGLIRTTDGNAYEIQIRQAAHAQHFNTKKKIKEDFDPSVQPQELFDILDEKEREAIRQFVKTGKAIDILDTSGLLEKILDYFKGTGIITKVKFKSSNLKSEKYNQLTFKYASGKNNKVTGDFWPQLKDLLRNQVSEYYDRKIKAMDNGQKNKDLN